jgi:methylmalonyl-CoA mutase
MRLAEPYERLRDASDAHLAKTGERPRIFLAALGPVAAFTARATFAKALFEAGGIAAPLNDGFLTPDSAAEAFRASGARIACLCSSDAVYEEMAVDAARALKRAGAERLYLAGKPGAGREPGAGGAPGKGGAPSEREASYRAAGVDGFVFAGCDALDILGEAHRSLGLAGA